MSLFSFLAPGTRAVPFSSASAFSLGRASSWPRSPAGCLSGPSPSFTSPSVVHYLLPFLPRTPDSVVTVPLKTNARPDGEIRLSRLVSSDGVRPGAEMMGEGKSGRGGARTRATHQRGSGGLIRSALSFVRHVLAHLFSLPSRVFPRLAFASWFQGGRAMLGPHHHHLPTPVFQA